MTRLLTIALLLASSARPPGAGRATAPAVAPLVEPAVSPGVARCTSDGACTVTDETGTRPGTPLALGPAVAVGPGPGRTTAGPRAIEARPWARSSPREDLHAP